MTYEGFFNSLLNAILVLAVAAFALGFAYIFIQESGEEGEAKDF